MARPPEPLEELLFDCTRVVLGEVIEVLWEGETPPKPEKAKDPLVSDAGVLSQAQRVKLRVTRVLKGDPCTELTVEKPIAPYLLAVGNKGPFFIEGDRIIGRYGPDTHRLQAVEAALASKR